MKMEQEESNVEALAGIIIWGIIIYGLVHIAGFLIMMLSYYY